MATSKSVCVFCGSSDGRDPVHRDLAQAFGAVLARENLRLVYGGGRIGLMGAVAVACFEAGGDVLGIIPEFLTQREVMYDEAPTVVVPNLHERKRRMAEEADVFVVLPGGVGTLEETVDVLSWAQLGLHAKPIIFLDTDGYWDPFFALLDHQIEQGFTPAFARDLVARADDIDDALARVFAAPARAAE